MKNLLTYGAVALGAAVIAVAAQTWWSLPPPARAEAPAVAGPTGPDPAQREVAALAATVEDLKARLAARDLSDRHARQSAAIPEAPVADPAATDGPPPPWAEADRERQQIEQRAQSTAWYDAQVALLNEQFLSQGSDPQWAPAAEAEVAGAFAGVPEQLAVVGLACGAVLCKVEAQRRADGEPVELAQVLHGTLGWAGPTMSKVDEETGEITIYLVRDGVDLPVAPRTR